MTPQELAFLRRHALAFAQGDEGYADWYLHWYGDEGSLDDVPDHSHVYPAYLMQARTSSGGAR